MSLQFIAGSSGSGKSYLAYQEMIRLSREEQGTKKRNYLILVPEQFTLQTQMNLLDMHPEHGIMNIDVLSFMRLAWRVFEEVRGEERMILEDTGKSIIVKKVLLNLQKDLTVYAGNIRKAGFVDEMKSLLSEFYQYSVTPAMLEEAKDGMDGHPALRNKLGDVIRVYEGFQEFLKERYITAEEVLDVLGEVLDESALVRDAVVCLDGFTGFTPSQYKLLSSLLRNASKVYMTVTMDAAALAREQKEHHLFYLSFKTMEKLKELANQEGVLIEEPIVPGEGGIPWRFRESIPLAALEKYLFRYPARAYKKPQEDIRIDSLRDKEAEVSFVAAQILRLVREKGFRYRDIAIVCGDIESYGRIIRREFLRAGIACFVDDKKNILLNPFVEFLRSGIEIAARDFSYESVFRYLRCGLAQWEPQEVDLLEEYVLALGIRGHGMWQKEWTRTFRTKRAVMLDTVNELRTRFLSEIMPLYEVLSDPSRNVLAYTTALYEFVTAHGIEEKLKLWAQEYKESGELLLAREYEQIYRIVMELFDRVAELLGEDILPLKEFSEIMETGFAEGEVGLIPPGVDQVVAGDIQRTRLTDVRALFFLGVNDGVVPKKDDGGGILSDMEREYLNRRGMELAPTRRQNSCTEQFYLYLCMTKPQEKLYLTYARLNEDGRAIRPSYLIGRLLAIFPALTIRQDTGNKIADVTGSDRGLAALKRGLREYAQGEQDPGAEKLSKELFLELYGLWNRSGPDERRRLARLVDGAFYAGRQEGISARAASLLYGRMLAGSVTRLETYAACAFAHFLAYGLELEERAEYKIGMPDIGTLFHSALELFSLRLKESEYNWHTLPDELRIEWGSESVRRAAQDTGSGIFADTKRSEYIITRVERIMQRALSVLTEQLRSGEFEPETYEMAFTCADRYLRLSGRIDRLDVYEEDGSLYLRVIDYKSGTTSFDYAMLYYGLQLQLGVYLNAVTRMRDEERIESEPANGKRPENKRIVPAGVFYYRLEDPIVEKGPGAEDERKKALRMDGVANQDTRVLGYLDRAFRTADGGLAPSVKSTVIPVETDRSGEITKRSKVANTRGFYEIMEHVNRKMAAFSEEIMDGRTDVNPYRMGDKTACDYCPYTSICSFDCRMEWDDYRYLKKLSGDDVWQRIRAEGKGREHGGGEMDGGAEKGN